MIQIQQRGSVMHQKLHTKCTVMERRTMTMDWEGLLDDDDDDRFFESFDRLSSAVPIDLASSGSDDDEGDDSRTSFASAMSSAPIHNMRGINPARAQASMLRDFNMWMAEPGSIKERRRRLLQGMGLSSNKNLLSRNNTRLKDSCSKRMNYDRDQPSTMSVNNSSPLEDLKLDTSPSPSSTPIFLIRSRSDGDIESFSANTDYVHVPETVFSLSERPVCSFTGHLDDVLDLSWSKSHVSFSPRLIKLVEPMGSFPSLLTRAEEQTLITMDILLSLLPFFRPRFKGGSKIASKAQTPDRERERVSGGRETTEMEKSKAEDSKPLATVEEIQRRLVRPPSLHSQSSTSSSTRPRNDDITSSESSSSTKRLEDYLDPILLSAIRAKIGGKRGLGGEMREKKEVEEFEWPVDELKVLMREAVELGDDDDGGVDVIGGVVGDDDDGVCWSPFQRFERTALKRFKGGVKDKQGMGEG